MGSFALAGCFDEITHFIKHMAEISQHCPTKSQQRACAEGQALCLCFDGLCILRELHLPATVPLLGILQASYSCEAFTAWEGSGRGDIFRKLCQDRSYFFEQPGIVAWPRLFLNQL